MEELDYQKEIKTRKMWLLATAVFIYQLMIPSVIAFALMAFSIGVTVEILLGIGLFLFLQSLACCLHGISLIKNVGLSY